MTHNVTYIRCLRCKKLYPQEECSSAGVCEGCDIPNDGKAMTNDYEQSDITRFRYES